uniref:Uncharacterized protein n=1 Tax=Serinus canaria TaxID=9135 RepID=A0A8C9MKG4_SERCA
LFKRFHSGKQIGFAQQNAKSKLRRGEKYTGELKIRIILVLNNPQVSQFRKFLGKGIIPVSSPATTIRP